MDDVELNPKLKQKVLMSTAVRQAIAEIIGENREEILTRARAKLAALGVTVTEAELGAQL